MGLDLDHEIEKLISQLQGSPEVDISNDIEKFVDAVGKSEHLTEEDIDPKESNDVRTRLGAMSMGEKIKAAMFGDRTVRGILIQDPNRLIQQFTLKNPQVGEDELEEYAQNPNTPKGVLRTISGSPTWMKGYNMKKALVFNAKCPVDISMKWIRFLNQSDLKKLSKSKNIPQTLATVCRKKLADFKKRK